MTMFGSPATDATLESRVASLEAQLASALDAIATNKGDADGQIATLGNARQEGDAAAQDGIDAAIQGSVARTEEVSSQLGGEIQTRSAEDARLAGLIGEGSEAVKNIFIPKVRGTLALDEVGGRVDDEDNLSAIQEWADYCQKTGAVGLLTKEELDGSPGTYTSKPAPIDLRAGATLSIEARPGTRIKGLPDLVGAPSDIAVLRLNGPTGMDPFDPAVPNVHLAGMFLDASARTFLSRAPTSTALTLRNLGHVTIDLSYFYGGPDYQAALDLLNLNDPNSTTTGGDSGISFTNVRQLDISRSGFVGFLDKGWYGSLSGRIRGWANFYDDCNTGGAFVRDGTSLTGWAEKVRRCGLGFGVTEGQVGGVWLPPAHDLFLTDCEFEEMGSRILRIIMASAKVKGCKVRDFGWQQRKAAGGLFIATPSQAAVRMDGAFNCDIEMDISMRDWPDSSAHVAFDLRDKTLNGVTYPCRDNNIRAFVSNLPNGRALVEINGTDRTNSVITVDNVATARSGGTGEQPIQTSTSAPNMSTHVVRPRGGKEYVLRNNLPWSTFFTVTPVAIGSPNVVFGAPTTNECHAQRNGDEVTTHLRLIAPFTLGADASFTGEIVGNMLFVTAMTSGALAVGHCIRWAGMSYSPVINALGTGTGGVGTYVLDLNQTVPAGTAMLSLMDGDIRFDAQTFTAAVGTGSIADKILTVATTSSGAWAVGQTVTGEGILSKTILMENLGGGQWRVSRAQTVALGAIKGVTAAISRGFCAINNTTMTVSVMVSGSLAPGQGIEGPGILPGTILREDLGGGNWRVSKSQTVPAATAFRTLPTGLPWIAAPTGGGDAEGNSGIDEGIIWPINSRTLVAQVPAGRDFLRCWFQSLGRALRVRDLITAGANLRFNATIIYRCED